MFNWFGRIILVVGLFVSPSVVLANPVPICPLYTSELTGVQVPIPLDCRVINKSGSQCVWCSIESLGRYHKIESVMNLTTKYKYATSEGPVRNVLNPLGVKYIMNHEGNRTNKQFLIDVCEKGWGAGVGLNGIHMVTLVHFKGGEVKFIDNLDPNLRVQTMTESAFMQRWDGWAISLIPPTNNNPLMPRSPSLVK